jgi:V/A-type H+-transporting ATPase subunit I
MFRPEIMSQAKILFLNDDSELVLDALHRHGGFHLTVKEAEGLATSDLSYKVQDLIGRLRDILGRADSLVADAKISSAQPPQSPISAPDWPSFVGMVDGEVIKFEKLVQQLETEAGKANAARSLHTRWSYLASSGNGRASLSYFNSYKSLTTLLLSTDTESPMEIGSDLPEPSIIYQLGESPKILLVVCLNGDKSKVLQLASEKGYSPLQGLEGMPQDTASLEGFIKDYGATLEKGDDAIKEGKASLLTMMPKMRQLSSVLSESYSVLSIKEKSSVEGRWSLIEGYVPTKQGSSLIGELNTSLNGRMIYSLAEEHSSPQVPVTFKYPKFFGWFYTITNLYGVPNYNELNPTPILALTFPILFGMMFGDIGHGIMLAALGMIMYRYVKSLSKIGLYLTICGIAGSIMGALLYGEAFGNHIYPGLITPHGVEEDIMQLLTFALMVGVFQISLGMVMGIANNIIQKKKVDALLIGVPRLALYFASISVLVLYGLEFTNWTSTPLYIISVPLFAFILAKPIYEMLKHGLRKGVSALGEMGFETFDTFIRFISNTVSYLRIFAMVVAHTMLSMVFYILGDMVGGGVMGIALAVLGNVFVVLLEGIIVLAQDLRLHFYEWFSKFYEDGGVRFSPFKLNNEIPIIKK